ncbi:MAG: hypothetical protein WC716_16790 [Chitinophagaceae bacterium]|jgi:hypothetical protein
MKIYQITASLYNAAVHLESAASHFLKFSNSKEAKDLLSAAVKRFEAERKRDIETEKGR